MDWLWDKFVYAMALVGMWYTFGTALRLIMEYNQ